MTARYRLLSDKEVAALAEDERARYIEERLAFHEEVATIKAQIQRTGRLEVGPGVFLPVPVPRAGRRP